jgi:hypothetical protein
MIPVNYIFIRHSQSTGNALNNMISKKIVTLNQANYLIDNVLIDPEVSPAGKFASTINGKVISDILKTKGIEFINVYGCSTLLRSMISAYYLSRNWEKVPDRIFVLPHLREIDENSNDKWSGESLKNVETITAYRMKDLKEQKEILQNMGILQHFDFSFVENNEYNRHSLGDISNFINWTNQNVLRNLFSRTDIPTFVNFFVITHAGVLSDFTKGSFVNNTGIIAEACYCIKNKRLFYNGYNNIQKELENHIRFVSNYSNNYYISINEQFFRKLL